MSVLHGNFSTVPGIDAYEARLLQDAYDAITLTENWGYFRSFAEESFMFSSAGSAEAGPLQGPMHRSAIFTQVQAAMKMMDDHSGSSYGFVMRTMEAIAKDSWERWVARRAAAR